VCKGLANLAGSFQLSELYYSRIATMLTKIAPIASVQIGETSFCLYKTGSVCEFFNGVYQTCSCNPTATFLNQTVSDFSTAVKIADLAEEYEVFQLHNYVYLNRKNKFWGFLAPETNEDPGGGQGCQNWHCNVVHQG
jgi:hypothetical protein